MTVRKDMRTAMPWKIVSIVFFLQMFSCFSMTMVYSFLPKLMKSYGISEVDTGTKAGIITSSMSVGVLLFSVPWGMIGDKKGKKISIIVSSAGLAITSLMFAFSYNYTWSLVTRLLQGCFYGAIGLNKAYMVQYLDDTNMGLGMALFTGTWTTAMILGPSLSGLLVFPSEQYPAVFGQALLFKQFPVLLPYLIQVPGLVITTIIAAIFLPNDKSESNTSEASTSSLITTGNVGDNDTFPQMTVVFDATEETSLIMTDEPQDYNANKTSTRGEDSDWDSDSDTVGNHTESTESNLRSIIRSSSILRLLRNKDCVLTNLIYTLHMCAIVGYDELLPLFAATSIVYHGYGFSTAEIGSVLLVIATSSIAFEVLMLPKIINRFGARKGYAGLSFILVFLIPLIPVLAFVNNRTTLYALLILLLLCIQVFTAGCFTCVSILVGNSVTPDLTCLAFGLSSTVGSIGGFIAPVWFGSMLTWSLKNVKDVKGNTHPLGFPFNQFFPFFMLSICFLLLCFGTANLASHLDKKKDNPDDKDNELLLPKDH